MTKIIAGFSTPKSGFQPFSWLIRWVCNSPFSHAYMRVFDINTQKWIIYQASGRVVNAITQEAFDSVEKVCAEFEIPVTLRTKQKSVAKAQDDLGKPYGVAKIFGIGWILLNRLFGKKVKNPFANGGATEICCEMLSEILDEKILDSDEIDAESCMPIDVFNFLVTKGYKRLV